MRIYGEQLIKDRNNIQKSEEHNRLFFYERILIIEHNIQRG